MASASGLSRFLILSTIKQLADAGSWHRGREYADDGNVHSLVVRGDTLTATVAGTHLYTVRLSAGKNGLAHRCSCPQGVDGDFCKHLVAVALSWLEAAKASPAKNGAAPRRDGPPLVTLDHLRPWLLRQPTEKLADLLLDAAVQHDRLREKLLREIARGRGRGSNIAGYRESITRATRTGGFLDYEEAGEFAEAVSEAITPLHELLQEGHPAAVIELAEHALARVESALHEADDSAGEIGALLDELQDLHLAACKAARPDPKELARRLCNWELGGDWDVFHHAAETYADVLGPSGLAEYRRQVEAAWNELPALGPGDREEYTSQRFRLTNIMEALARTTGDLDAVVAIKAKNLSHAYAFLQIAELYGDARRHDDALAWAERGLKAFPKNTDSRLLEFLATEYHRRGRHDEAIALGWRQFDERPSLETYRVLKSHADRPKPSVWPVWRERALALIRERIARTQRVGRSSFWSRDVPLRSVLVEVFLWEKDVDAAWREAQTGECHGELVLRLAAAREKTHPADVLPIYVRHAEGLIAQKNNQTYQKAVSHLKKVKALHLALGQSREWAALRARLLTEHKPKRNFMALAAKL